MDLLIPFLFSLVPKKGLLVELRSILFQPSLPPLLPQQYTFYYVNKMPILSSLEKDKRRFKTSSPFLMTQDSVTSLVLKIAFLKSSASRVSERYFKNNSFIFCTLLSASVLSITGFYLSNGITSVDMF